MTTARAGTARGRRSGPVHSLVSFAVVLLTPCAHLPAQDSPAAAPEITRILVPADDPATWPPGDWEPLPADQYQSLRNSAVPASRSPRDAWIERAEYSAEFVDDALRAGTLEAVVRRLGDAPRLVPLDPLNLAIDSLWWDRPAPAAAPPATWGTTADGRSALLAQGDDSSLRGRWSLKGRKLSHGVDFDVQLPQATVTRLSVRVPVNYRLTASAGDVASEESDDARSRDYRITLGGQTRCRLRLVPVQDGPAPRPRIVVERGDVAHTVRRDGLQFQGSFVAEVSRQPVNRLHFQLPADSEVYSVTWAGDTQLATRSHRSGGQQTLAVDLPEPLLGRSRPIRVQGFAPTRVGERWALPHITLRGTVDLGGKYQLTVENPLQLQDLQTVGYRQTEIVARPGESTTFTFARYLTDAEMAVTIDAPRLDLSARTVAHVDASAETWTLRADLTWQARSGRAFAAACAVAPGWEVTEVRLDPAAGEPAPVQWDLESLPRGESRLRVEFPDALAEGQPRTVRILARHPATVAGPTTSLVPIRPLDVEAAESVVAVTHPPGDSLRIDGRAGLTEIEPAAVPRFAAEARVWRELLSDASSGTRRVFHAASPAASVSLERPEPAPATRADQTIDLDADRLAAHLTLRIEPRSQPVDRVIVHVTSPGVNWDWTVPDEADVSLTAHPFSAGRGAEWDLPETGESWELRLSRPLTDTFRVEAAGTAAADKAGRLPLVLVPQSREFAGAVELRSRGESVWDVTARGLEAAAEDVAAPPTGPAAFRTVGRWQYVASAEPPELTAREVEPSATRDRLVLLRLRSLLSDVSGGDDVHEARYRLLPTRHPAPFRFALPDAAALFDVRLDGEPLVVSRRDGEYVLPLLAAGQPHDVSVRYRSASPGGLLRDAKPIPVPLTSYTTLEFHWTIALPPDARPGSVAAGVRLTESLPDLSWSQRLFGPLGRPRGEPIFNPLRSESWRALAEGPADSKSDAGSPQDDSIPPGWTVWHASAPLVPESLTLSVWHAPRVRLLAWAALLGSLAGGLALRLRRVSWRQRAAAVGLAACSSVAWVCPEVPALIAGGCFTGILLAVLLPRKVVFRQRRAAERASTLDSSTESYRRAVAVASGLLAALVIPAVRAADVSSAHPGGSTPALAVMVPVDADGRPAGDVVYVSRALRDRLQRPPRNATARSDYLIAAAAYEIHVAGQKSAAVEARYRLAVLPHDETVRVLLPITDAYLAGADACFVDGVASPVLKAEGRDAYLIELQPPPPDAGGTARALAFALGAVTGGAFAPQSAVTGFGPRREVREVEVVLRLYLPAAVTPRGGTLDFGIPSVPGAQVLVRFDEAPRRVDIAAAQDPQVAATPGEPVRTTLGRAERLRLAWSSESEPSTAPPSVEAQLACLAEVQPTWAQLRCRATYKVLQGSVESVVWDLPAGTVPRIAPDAPFSWTLLPDRGDRERLILDFPSPQTGTFAVDIALTLPIDESDGVVRVPGPKLLEPDAGVTAYQTGVSTTTSFRLVPHTAEMDGIQRIAGGSLVDVFPRVAGAAEVKAPDVAYQSPRPIEPVFRITPATPQRKVWLAQTGRAEAGTLTWIADATVETIPALAFRHVLRIDPDFRIESVLVREGEADRLLHWTRRGDRVVLTLRDKTAATQFVRITGSRPLALDEPIRLPGLRFEEADLADSRLELHHGADVTVEFDGTPPPPASPSSTEPTLAGEYRLPTDGTMPTIIARRRTVPARSESVALLLAGEAGRQLKVAVRIADNIRPDEPVRVRIPSRLVPGHQLATSDAELTLDPQQDGSLDLVLQATSDRAPVVVITSPAPDPRAPGEALLLPQVLGGATETRYLAIPATARDAGGSAARVPRSSLPSWAGDALPELSDGEWTILRSGDFPGSLLAGARSRAPEPPRTTLTETRLHWDGGGTLWGATTLVLAPSQGGRLTFSWPRDLALRAAVLDGRPATVIASADAGQRSLIVEAAARPQTATLYWNGPAARPGLTGTLSPDLPLPANSQVGLNLIRIESPAGAWFRTQTGVEPASAEQYALDSLEARLAAFEGAREDADSASLAALIRLHDALAKTFADFDARTPDEAAAYDRFVRLAPQVEALRPQALFAAPDGDVADDAPSADGEAPWRTNRHSELRGAVSAEAGGLSASVICSLVLRIALGLAIGLSVLLLVWKLLRPAWSDRLHARPTVACGLLGLVWWTCLAPSILGLGLILLAATPWIRSGRAAAPARHTRAT